MLDREAARVMPLEADLAEATRLTITAVRNRAEALVSVVDISAVRLADEPVAEPSLSVANLQPRDRTIADLAGLETVLKSDARDMINIAPVCSAVRNLAQLIDVPDLNSGIAGDPSGRPSGLSISSFRLRQHYLARIPHVAAPITTISTPISLARPQFAAGGRA